VIILLDAMGGDNAPDATIKGAVKAVKEINADICLIGDEKIINEKSNQFFGKNLTDISPKLKIKHASQQIEMEDIPTHAIKQKKDSSMVVGFRMLKEGEGDVLVSAGNSGALLTGATLLVGRIKGIDRPAIAPILPAYKSRFLLMDAGANTNCKVQNLVQFAQMSTIYLKNNFGIKNPKVGLLNIGTEETKGNDLVKETYNILKEHGAEYGVNFIGNVEARDPFEGNVDAVITDGFTGNVFLKAIEGLGKFVKVSLTESLTGNLFSKMCAIPSLPAIKKFKKMTDYKEYGGALFLGVKRPVVKAHGSSDELLFYYTLKQAEDFVKGGSVEQMVQEFEKMKEN